MANEQNLKPFVKGDKRINRKGRPKSFDALRELAKQIADEKTESGYTRVELILRSWSLSKTPALQNKFMEIAYGKVPDEIDLKSDNNVTIKVVYDDSDSKTKS